MSVICPTVTAFDLHEYRNQLQIASKLSSRVHIDLMDGIMAPTKSPRLPDIWLSHISACDIHLMYKNPMKELGWLVKLKPSMVIVQAEAEVHHMHFAGELHGNNMKAGLAILQDTPIKNIQQIMHSFDHILIFSGNLGFHSGHADLSLLEKTKQIRDEYPDVEIGWDGGVNDKNVRAIAEAGIDVLNVGGFIQKSDNPHKAYQKITDSLI